MFAEWRQNGVDVGRLVGAASAALIATSGNEVYIGADAGQSVAEDNILPAVILLVQGAMIAWTAYELYDNATTAYELVTAYANGELTDEQFEDALLEAGLNAVIDASVGKLKILEKSYELARKAGLTDKADDLLRKIASHNNGGIGGPNRTLPSGYTRNVDGSVTGPRGGTYSTAGTDLNGQQVYRDSGGRYYTLDGGTKTQVSNPAGSPNVAITQQHAHHQDYVNDISGQLKGQGYTTSSGGFYSSCGSTICYPDITYSAPGSNKITGVIEVKTGGAGPSTNQSIVYPQIGTGDAIPGPSIANAYGLDAGIPMNQQGYPNGIPVYQITAPGLGQ
ncbi:hypothetical protein SAMN02744133_104202 [Thalassospira xiamenensis M-5 = DSM 17429]|nr:hypothetical protein SAMN02744133_104202 [Thalassospira xiamenensis M-5 = DSM 17429]